LAKVIIVYETKYGNTKLVAEKIIEGMREVGGIETTLSEIKDFDLNKLANYDAILIGSPNHIGDPTRGIKKFIDKLRKLSLSEKSFAVFDTYLGKDFEKAVKKMQKQINEKVPGSKIISPGLSIRVEGMKGPISEEELPKCIEFGKRIANLLKT
jgi:menaquinone-dependent protoporphyrinogen IX oxidase